MLGYLNFLIYWLLIFNVAGGYLIRLFAMNMLTVTE